MLSPEDLMLQLFSLRRRRTSFEDDPRDLMQLLLTFDANSDDALSEDEGDSGTAAATVAEECSS